jgi:hypothetical protein
MWKWDICESLLENLKGRDFLDVSKACEKPSTFRRKTVRNGVSINYLNTNCTKFDKFISELLIIL